MFTRCLPKPRPPARKSIHEGAREMIRTALVVAMFAFGATALVAQSDPIAARRALMKANGDQSKIATDMLEAKRPFNLDEAKKVLATFAEAGEKAPALFPDNSKTGGDTAALPAIWENKADFTARLAKFASDSKAPWAQPRISTASRFKSPRYARTAAVATRPTARRRHSRLQSSQLGAAVGATGRPRL